jgi:hypothetical protein
MTDSQNLISDERVRAWLESAEADADRRGLPELKPVLRLFAQATAALRGADWNGLTPPDDDQF